MASRVTLTTRIIGIVLGCTALASAWACSIAGGALPRRMLADFASAPHGALLLNHVLLVAAAIFPIAIGLGAAFPLALDLSGAGSQPARRLGVIYAANTLAAVAGSMATGFVTIPWLGLERAMTVATLLLVLGSAVALARAAGTGWTRLGGLVPAGLGVLLIFASPPWDRALLASGAYKYAASVAAGLDLETALKAPAERDALTGLVESAVGAGRQDDALAFLRTRAAAAPGDAATVVALSRLHAAGGAFDEALRLARDAAAMPSSDPAALEQLASIYADLGDAEQLARVVEARSAETSRPSAHYFAASVHFLRGELEPALAEVRRTLALDPRHARAHNLAGAIHASLGQAGDARAAFESALTLNPRDPTTYQNLAPLELNTGNRATAARLFAEALSLDPTAAAARQGLKTATETDE
jgi:Flp pilus assembly protein TadD